MIGIDLKLPIVFADNTFNFLLKGRTDVHWANNFLSTFRLSAEETIRQVCTKISRQSSDKIFLMLRPISFDVFRTNYPSQKPSRHETSLRAMEPKPYHCGFRSNISRTTSAKANANRHWWIKIFFKCIKQLSYSKFKLV